MSALSFSFIFYSNYHYVHNHSECAFFLPLSHNEERGTVISDYQLVAEKATLVTRFPLRRKALRLIIVVANIVFVREQRRDTHYRNDPKKYGLKVL